MARQRVLMLVRPAVGGMAAHVLSLALGCDRSEFQPVLVAPEGYWVLERAREYGIASYGVQFGDGLHPGQDRRAVAQIRGIAIAEGAGLLHSHGLKADLLASLAISSTSIKHISTLHIFPVRRAGLSGLASHMVTRYISRGVDHYIAVSRALARELTSGCHVDPGKVSVIPNGLVRAIPEDYSGGELARLDSSLDGPLVGTVGRLVWEKGMEDFIRAARLLGEEFSQARFWIVGDGPLRARLQGLVGRLGLEGRVLLLGHQADVLPWLAAMDVFVTCPVSEGFSLVTLEAMASGKPVVATATGGLPELIRCGENGLLVPVRDPAALARAVAFLLRQPDLARELAARARQVSRRYTAQSMAEQTQSVYERVLKRASQTCAGCQAPGRAILVAEGNQTKPGEDFFNTFLNKVRFVLREPVKLLKTALKISLCHFYPLLVPPPAAWASALKTSLCHFYPLLVPPPAAWASALKIAHCPSPSPSQGEGWDGGVKASSLPPSCPSPLKGEGTSQPRDTFCHRLIFILRWCRHRRRGASYLKPRGEGRP